MQSDVRVTYSKAIGIILMVLGHCSCSVPYVTQVIYMFHMPLFFSFWITSNSCSDFLFNWLFL